jgi:hypothetical protein
MTAAVPIVQAEEVTRESYKEAVEPICKSNVRDNERILNGVKVEIKQGKLKPAAKQFIKAADVLHRALGKLKAVPQPTADEARLAKWLGYIQQEEGYFRKIAKKLNAGDKNGALAMQFRLEHTANVANNLVLGFEFHYCRVEPSKFT